MTRILDGQAELPAEVRAKLDEIAAWAGTVFGAAEELVRESLDYFARYLLEPVCIQCGTLEAHQMDEFGDTALFCPHSGNHITAVVTRAEYLHSLDRKVNP